MNAIIRAFLHTIWLRRVDLYIYSSCFASSIHLYGDSNETMAIHCFVAHNSLWKMLHQRSMLLKKRTSASTGSVPNPNQKRSEALELLGTSKTTSSISEKERPKAILQSSINHISLVYLFMNDWSRCIQNFATESC